MSPSPRTVRNSSAATARSRPVSKSSCRRRMTPRFVASPSRTRGRARAKSRSPHMRRSCLRRQRPTPPIPPFRTCSSRPRALPTVTRCSPRADVRAPEDPEVWLAHVIAVEGETIGDLEWETDRGLFLGRGRQVREPYAELDDHRLSNTVGSVLDPIISLRRRIRIRPGKTVRVAFSTLVASSREHGARPRRQVSRRHHVRAGRHPRLDAGSGAAALPRHCPDEAHLFQTLGGAIVFPDRAVRAAAEVLSRAYRGGRGALGARDFGRPADRPRGDRRSRRRRHRAAVAARPRLLADKATCRRSRDPERSRAILPQDLQILLETLVRSSQSMDGGRGPRTGLHAPGRPPDAAQRDVLESVARVGLSSRRGTLAEQVDAQRNAPTAGR